MNGKIIAFLYTKVFKLSVLGSVLGICTLYDIIQFLIFACFQVGRLREQRTMTVEPMAVKG